MVPLCPTCSDITFLVKAEPIGWISSSERILKELNGRILVNLRRDKGIFLGKDEKLVFKEILLEKMDKEDYTKILNSFILEVESLGKLEELKEVTLLTEEPLPESARKFALKFFKEIKVLD